MKIFRMKILIATWGERWQSISPSKRFKIKWKFRFGRCSPFVIKIMRLKQKSMFELVGWQLLWHAPCLPIGLYHCYRYILPGAKTHLYDDIRFLKLGENDLRYVSINGCWLVHLYCIIFRVFTLTGFHSGVSISIIHMLPLIPFTQIIQLFCCRWKWSFSVFQPCYCFYFPAICAPVVMMCCTLHSNVTCHFSFVMFYL